MSSMPKNGGVRRRKPQLKSVINFRDVGSTVNAFLASLYVFSSFTKLHINVKSRILNEGLLFRSARPDEASTEDRKTLHSHLKIKTIIDLRSTTEHQEQLHKHQTLISKAKAASPSSDEAHPSDSPSITIQPLRVQGIAHVPINFNGSAFSRMLVRNLSWLKFLWMLVLMLFGGRISAIGVVAKNVMQSRGLSGLAIDSLDVCGAEVKGVFDVLAEEGNYPILVHCTQGKDRTGLVVQLVLMMLGVRRDAIEHDYMMSAAELTPGREERVREVATIGLREDFADCDPELVKNVERHVNSKYGSIHEYLRGVGVSSEQQESIRELFLQEIKA
jgi:protein-tyrosine phosphatase